MDIIIDKAFAGKTIKTLLRGDIGYSSGMLKKLKFSEGGILVNGAFQNVRYELKEGDVLSLATEDTKEDTSPYIIPVPIDINIAYEDSEITIVDKKADMPTHPSLGHKDDTVANALAYKYRNSPYVFRPVNRLDRDTSGLMITANNRHSAYVLYKAMISDQIGKVYIAILDRKPENEKGELVSYMNRCEDSIVKRRICNKGEADAKLAITLYETLYSCDKFTAVCAVPVTGRTHQLRLHFSSIGCPIAGDTMYGYESSDISRQALHSSFLSFPHPKTNEVITLFSSLPKDIKNYVGEIAANIIEEKFANIAPELSKLKNEYK